MESRGGAGKHGRSEEEAPVGGQKLKKVKLERLDPIKFNLANKMRGYMLEMRSDAKIAKAEMAKGDRKPKKGSWVCTMSKCQNTYSGSTVFAEGVAGAIGIRRELERLYPDFTREFFKTFENKTQLQKFFNVLRMSDVEE